jgi:hypothetical protein
MAIIAVIVVNCVLLLLVVLAQTLPHLSGFRPWLVVRDVGKIRQPSLFQLSNRSVVFACLLACSFLFERIFVTI